MRTAAHLISGWFAHTPPATRDAFGVMEYRVIAREQNVLEDSDCQPQSDDGFVNVAAKALLGVILGALMDPRDADWAKYLMASTQHPTEIWRARLEPGRYALKFARETYHAESAAGKGRTPIYGRNMEVPLGNNREGIDVRHLISLALFSAAVTCTSPRLLPET